MVSLLDVLGPPQTSFLQYKGGCSTCPRKLVDFVPAVHRPNGIISVGEAPGETEVRTKEGFTGKSGVFYREVLREIGIIDASWTNVVHCRPPNNDTPGDREISCCMAQHTQKDVRGYPFVVLLGSIAFHAFYPGSDIRHFRGNLAYHPDYPDQRFFTTWHPAAVLRNRPSLEEEFRRHIRRLGWMMQSIEPFELVTPTHPQFEDLQNALDTWDIFSFDFETTGTDTWSSATRLRSWSLATVGQVFASYHEDPGFGDSLQKIASRFGRSDCRVVGSQVGFDLVLLEKATGVRVRAQTGELGTLYYQCAGYREASMKQLVSEQLEGYRHLVPEPHNETNVRNLLMYNGEDSHYGLQLFQKGVKRLTPLTLDLYTRVAGQIGMTLTRVSDHGMVVNAPAVLSAQKNLEARKLEAIAAWQTQDPRFIPNVHLSGKGFLEYAFQICGAPVIKTTEKAGKPAVDDDVLQEWMRQGIPWAGHAVDVRSIDKERSTFVDPLLKTHMREDGRVHAHYLDDSTDTGRLSSRNPNMQNNPRKKYIRSQYGVPPGFSFFSGDFNQIELRIGMCLSRDPVGIGAYANGSDVHYTTAQQFAGPDPTKEQRTYAKAINFALLFGGGPHTVRDYARNVYNIEFTEQQSYEFHKVFFATYRMLPEWHKQSNAALNKNEGRFISPVGHCFYFKGWNSEDDGLRSHVQRAHINSQCQGTASYICLYTMILADQLLYDAGLEGFIIGNGHDAILAEVRQGQEHAVAEVLTAATTKTREWLKSWFVVPLVMEYEVGPDWGNLEKLEYL